MKKFKSFAVKYKGAIIYALSVATAALLGAYFTSTLHVSPVTVNPALCSAESNIVNEEGIVYELVKPIRDVYSINVFTKTGNVYCDVPMEQYYTITQGDRVTIELKDNQCAAVTNLTQVIPVESSDVIG